MITEIPFTHRQEFELAEYKSLREELCSKQETSTHFLHITIGGICAILALVCKDIFQYGESLIKYNTFSLNNPEELIKAPYIFPLILPILLLAVGIPLFCLLSLYHLQQERQWLYSIIGRIKTIENDLTQDGNFKFWEQCVHCRKNEENSCGDGNCYLNQKEKDYPKYYQLLQETKYYHEQIIPLIFLLVSLFCQVFAYLLVYVYLVPSVLKPDFSIILKSPNYYALGLTLILLTIMGTSLFFQKVHNLIIKGN